MRRAAKVTFRFPGSIAEIKYLESPPSPGARIESLHGDSWTVSAVEADPYGSSYIITCVPFVETRRKIRDLVADLFEKARASHQREGIAARERHEDAKRQ